MASRIHGLFKRRHADIHRQTECAMLMSLCPYS